MMLVRSEQSSAYVKKEVRSRITACNSRHRIMTSREAFVLL